MIYPVSQFLAIFQSPELPVPRLTSLHCPFQYIPEHHHWSLLRHWWLSHLALLCFAMAHWLPCKYLSIELLASQLAGPEFMCYVLTLFDHFIFFLQLVSCLLNWVISSHLFSLSTCFFPSFSYFDFLSFFSFSSTVCDACPSLPLFISIHNRAFILVLLGKLVYLPPRNLDILMRRWPCFLRQWLEE